MKEFKICFFNLLLGIMTLSGSASAHIAQQDMLQKDLNPATLCTSHTSQQAVAVVTFDSETTCNDYVGALVLGAPIGYAYSNCTSSSYCMHTPCRRFPGV